MQLLVPLVFHTAFSRVQVPHRDKEVDERLNAGVQLISQRGNVSRPDYWRQSQSTGKSSSQGYLEAAPQSD